MKGKMIVKRAGAVERSIRRGRRLDVPFFRWRYWGNWGVVGAAPYRYNLDLHRETIIFLRRSVQKFLW